MRRILYKSFCVGVCTASLVMGAANTGNLQTVSGEAGITVYMSCGDTVIPASTIICQIPRRSRVYTSKNLANENARGYKRPGQQYENIATIKKSSGKNEKNTQSGWSEDKKYYYNKDGERATGIVLIKGKLYCFKSNGKYNKSKTKKIQKAAVYEKPFSNLKKYLGKPKKSQYLTSCYGKGKDGILTYDNFKVYTFRPDKGSEIFMGAE